MKKVIASRTATTVDELIAALHYLGPQRQIGEVYVTINSDSIRVNLVEETLTDGSKVYNYELTEASKSFDNRINV